MRKKVMVAVSNWMHVDFFTLDQAAALWCDFDPSQVKSYEIPPEVAAAKQLLIGGLISGGITPNSKLGTYSHVSNYLGVHLSRYQLVQFAQNKKLFPAFLFNTLAPFKSVESRLDRLFNEISDMSPVLTPEPTVNKGGRPVEYDWDSFMLEIICRANTPDGLPDSQAELVRDMLQWFSVTTGSEPAESSIKLRTSKIYKYLDDKKGLAKNRAT